MIKRFLTILTLISLFFLIFHSWFLSLPKPLLVYAPELRESFISPTVWQIDSSQPLENLSLSAPKPLPIHKIVPLCAHSYAIHFNPNPTGWFGSVWLTAEGKQIKHQKKTFLNLANPHSTSLKIISFSPIASKNYRKSLELEIQKTGSLNGLRLEIEQANNATRAFYLPDVWVKEGEIWKFIFDPDKENLSVGRKQIFIPYKLSDSAGILSLIESSAFQIQDTLIYRRETSSSANGWGTSSFQRKVERIKGKKGFPYPLEKTADFILLTKGLRFNETLSRKKMYIPFSRENAQIESRKT